ncbi:MAG TPA: deoxynucleoside kinase [Caldithrix abyssi]|uniref:Deoxynucleoside kinase n=1 Tax=Caldithrix abyssi TaxID=187145 RepID=A0A7V4U1L1_CALAY|nr:deoxynucleoside kinase [Caldithrix abyssi]
MSLDNLHYIAVEGVIGAGKTSLADKLAKTLGAATVLEEFEQNPFLEEFYNDPQRYAFQTQVFFLISRFQQLQDLRQIDMFHNKVVSDYIFEKDRIFATLNLTAKEMKLYDGIARLMEKEIPVPDMVIYLQASTPHLMDNIRKRGRSYEKQIKYEYIDALNELYNKFFFHYNKTPLLVISTDELDFVHSEKDYRDILTEIDNHTAGTRYYIPQKTDRK